MAQPTRHRPVLREPPKPGAPTPGAEAGGDTGAGAVAHCRGERTGARAVGDGLAGAPRTRTLSARDPASTLLATDPETNTRPRGRRTRRRMAQPFAAARTREQPGAGRGTAPGGKAGAPAAQRARRRGWLRAHGQGTVSGCKGCVPYFFNYVTSEEGRTTEKVKRSRLPGAGGRGEMNGQDTEKF